MTVRNKLWITPEAIISFSSRVNCLNFQRVLLKVSFSITRTPVCLYGIRKSCPSNFNVWIKNFTIHYLLLPCHCLCVTISDNMNIMKVFVLELSKDSYRNPIIPIISLKRMNSMHFLQEFLPPFIDLEVAVWKKWILNTIILTLKDVPKFYRCRF